MMRPVGSDGAFHRFAEREVRARSMILRDVDPKDSTKIPLIGDAASAIALEHDAKPFRHGTGPVRVAWASGRCVGWPTLAQWFLVIVILERAAARCSEARVATLRVRSSVATSLRPIVCSLVARA